MKKLKLVTNDKLQNIDEYTWISIMKIDNLNNTKN